MQTIDDLVDEEEAKLNWFDKLSIDYPQINTTKILASHTKEFVGNGISIVRPSILEKVIGTFLIGFPCMGAWLLVRTLLVPTGLFVIVLLLLLFVLGMIAFLMYHVFFNKKLLFNITLNDKYIKVRNDSFVWNDIIETYIMHRKEGRTTGYYLILHTKTNGFKKYDLYKFSISVYKLSAMTEYYKKQNPMQA